MRATGHSATEIRDAKRCGIVAKVRSTPRFAGSPLMKSEPDTAHAGPDELPHRLIRLGVPAALFVGLTLLRTHGITRSFWMFDDQIRYWDTALLPFTDLPWLGPQTHHGGHALGPGFYWVLWIIRVMLGPWFDNLPHAGAIG